jgi:hypothetical protein
VAKRRRRRQGKQHVALLNRVRPHYDRLLEQQGGKCGICGRAPSERRRLDIDHDHKTMKIRGLLCARCNRAIPNWMTESWCRKATDYLENGPIDWLEDLLEEAKRV